MEYDHDPDFTQIAEGALEPDEDDKMLGFIGAMLDGIITRFRFHDVIVNCPEEADGIRVYDDDMNQIGGVMHREGADVEDVFVWLGNKSEVYGNG